ncbi:MAG TPA: UDP-N-acetylmuramate--L-alanine ligase [Anaerolineae bacterium]|nr:UDP-N-acetylmuramate--L-alanine ligase [Anaerolineae bacterium]
MVILSRARFGIFRIIISIPSPISAFSICLSLPQAKPSRPSFRPTWFPPRFGVFSSPSCSSSAFASSRRRTIIAYPLLISHAFMTWQALFRLEPHERRGRRIHLVGIGGTGLAPIARVLLQMGFRVSGSDQAINERTEALKLLGARIFAGHRAEQLLDDAPPRKPDLLLISSAVPEDNPEVQQARAWDIPVVKRKDILGPLTADRDVLAVAGTHGKTTTTALITHILARAGRRPGYIIGSEIPALGFSDAGEEPLFIIEADEYDHMFLGLRPWRLIITNLDWDHPDLFPTRAAYEDAFSRLLAQMRPDGRVIYWRDDPVLRAWERRGRLSNGLSYGSFRGAYARAENVEMTPAGVRYLFVTPQGAWPVQLSIQGMHNVLNSMAALLAAGEAGLAYEDAIPHLVCYRGAARRFEFKGEAAGVMVIDDYAHHPTEVQSTLQAARAAYPDRTIWAIYQPHTYSRPRTFLDLFNGAFSSADHVIVTDIYAAREPRDATLTPERVAAATRHERALAIRDLDAIADFLAQTLRPNSLVIILSAGSATRLGPLLLDRLASKARGAM